MSATASERIGALVFDLRRYMAQMTDDERREMLADLLDGYCPACGTETGGEPCYCENDE